MKKIVFSFCIIIQLGAVSQGFAQNKVLVDSLQKIVNSKAHDTVRIQALSKLAWEFHFAQSDQAPRYARAMARDSKKAGYTKGLWDAYNIMGVIHYSVGSCDSAIYWLLLGKKLSDDVQYHNQFVYGNGYAIRCLLTAGDFGRSEEIAKESFAFAIKSGVQQSIIKAYLQLAFVDYAAGNYQRCIINFLKADSVIGDRLSMDKGQTLQNISQIYHILENPKSEKHYLGLARSVYEQIKNDYGLHAVLLAEGLLALTEKDYQTANREFLKAVAYFETHNDKYILADSYRSVALSFYYLKDYNSSLRYYRKAIETNPGVGKGDQNLNYIYHEMGRLLLDMNKPYDALSALEQAMEISKARGDLNMIIDVNKQWARYYASVGNYPKALDLNNETFVLVDSLNKIRSSKVLAETEARFQNEQKQRSIDLLTAQHNLVLQSQQSQKKLIVVVITSAALIIVVLFFLFRIKHRADIKLRKLDLLRTHFFSNISHEFRTPLMLIMGPAETRMREEDTPVEIKQEMELIHRQGKQLLHLVDQLLGLSRLEAGAVKLKLEQGDVFLLMNTVAESFQFLADKKHIKYVIDIKSSAEMIWFDRDAVQKIVVNLLSNAFKYTPEQGDVSISCSVQSSNIHISVSNSGEGIPNDKLAKIFERFYQVEHNAGGIGIGLALVNELVQLYGGRVGAESNPGQLTTFTVTLPSEKALLPANAIVVTNALASEKNLVSAEPDVHNHTELPLVLIAEDNDDVRAFIRKTLEHHFRCIEAPNGKKAHLLAATEIPDLIISDIMMPDMDGLSLCKKLKSEEPTSHIPVLLLTAKSGEADQLQGLESGADDYIVKPFNSELLLVRIRKLIETRKALHARFSQEVVLRPKEIVLNSSDQQFLQKVQLVMDKYLTDSELTAERFAEEVGMSRMQLHRKLSGLTGMSANTFIRTHRLKMAAQLLLSSDINISEVGYHVGFSDPSYFSRCFKEHFQCSPTEFTKQAPITPAKL